MLITMIVMDGSDVNKKDYDNKSNENSDENNRNTSDDISYSDEYGNDEWR